MAAASVDHLAEVCKLLYGHGTEQFNMQLRQWRATLRQGGAAVIDELRQIRDAQRAARSRRRYSRPDQTYFEANRQRMNYQQYRDDHLPIGNGTVESACKHVVAARMKGSDMTWTLAGAQHMLQLRASIMGSRYPHDHQQALTAPPQPAELPMAA